MWLWFKHFKTLLLIGKTWCMTSKSCYWIVGIHLANLSKTQLISLSHFKHLWLTIELNRTTKKFTLKFIICKKLVGKNALPLIKIQFKMWKFFSLELVNPSPPPPKKWGICDKIFTFNYKLHVREISHQKMVKGIKFIINTFKKGWRRVFGP
jgi:hypothetical protein